MFKTKEIVENSTQATLASYSGQIQIFNLECWVWVPSSLASHAINSFHSYGFACSIWISHFHLFCDFNLRDDGSQLGSILKCVECFNLVKFSLNSISFGIIKSEFQF